MTGIVVDSGCCLELAALLAGMSDGKLAARADQRIVVWTRHRSIELANATAPVGSSPRVLAPELTSILMAHDNGRRGPWSSRVLSRRLRASHHCGIVHFSDPSSERSVGLRPVGLRSQGDEALLKEADA